MHDDWPRRNWAMKQMLEKSNVQTMQSKITKRKIHVLWKKILLRLLPSNSSASDSLCKTLQGKPISLKCLECGSDLPSGRYMWCYSCQQKVEERICVSKVEQVLARAIKTALKLN